jgi:hypothetical protein
MAFSSHSADADLFCNIVWNDSLRQAVYRTLTPVTNAYREAHAVAKLNGASANHCHEIAKPRAATGTIEQRIKDFLDGKTHGEDVLNALYGQAMTEPVPERLLAVLRR